jgi:hypothetical protein
MTTTQKMLLTATLTLAVSAVVYEWHRASEMEKELQGLRNQQASSTGQLERLRRECDEASRRAAFLASENAVLKDDAAELSRLREEAAQSNAAGQVNAAQSAAESWLERVAELKERLEQTPNAKIPELQFVTEQDWLNAAKRELKTDADYRRALSEMRSAGENKFSWMLFKAIDAYRRGNNRQSPTDLAQLLPYFDSQVDDAILQRWTMLPSDSFPNMRLGGDMVITQKTPVDDVFDRRYIIGASGGWGNTDFLESEIRETMTPVLEAYQATHSQSPLDDFSQLRPYATTPEQRAALEKLILRQSASK